MAWLDLDLRKHGLDVGDDSDKLNAKAYDHAYKRVDEVGPLEEVIVERTTLESSGAIEYDSNLPC